MRKSIKVIIICALSIVLFLWISGLLNLWINGIHVVANDVDGYHLQTYSVEGDYTVSIDLSDLKSNEGKVLYDDGENRIYVAAVFINNRSNYQIEFRSSGSYGLNGATLVSGIEHTHNNNGFRQTVRVNGIASYQGETFKLNPSIWGFTYKDGDFFQFSLTPNDIDLEIDPNKDANMVLKLSNLYMHEWEKY